jgi:hypothetical protein
MARDYKRELATEKKNHPERVKERAERNAARAKVEKVVGKSALANKEVDHQNGRTSDNRASNLRIVSPRSNNNGRRGGAARGR